MMFYDLHMHSCLSPCAEDEMTPNNICNMALIKGLELIAVTDHNSVRQLPAMQAAAEKTGIKLLYGCELESSEEVHMLGLFGTLEKAMSMQPWIDSRMPGIPNDESFFGKQEIMNGDDEIIGIEKDLLIVSLTATLDECAQAVHERGGRVVLAHVLDRKNSVTTQLGFIPMDLKYDGLEVKREEQIDEVLKRHPWIKRSDTEWFIDSDAHTLIDISEAEHSVSEETLHRLWGDVL